MRQYAALWIGLIIACGPVGSDDKDDVVADTGFDTGGEGIEADPRFDALRDAILSDLARSDAPGVSVAVYLDGAVVFAEGFGSAHPNEDVEVQPSTLFQIGSTTKMLTSIAMLQDVQDGALTLDDSLALVYPGSDFGLNTAWNDQLQMQHLLTHEGGLFEYYDVSANPDDAQLALWHEDVYFPNIWLMSPPGAFWNYSNLGYSIAGMVVESMDGRAYPDLMTDRIFTPLGMDRTYQRHEQAKEDGDYALGIGFIADSLGYTSYGPVLMPDVPDAATMRPAGGGTWSTPTQMLNVADFLLNGAPEVLDDALLAALTSPQSDMRAVPDVWSYGYGLMLGGGLYIDEKWQEVEVWAHGGNTYSYTSDFYILPEHDFAISILSSGYGTNFYSSVTTAISTLVDLGEPETAPDISWDLERLDDHVGTYMDSYNVGEIEITRTGTSLYIRTPQLDELGYTVTPELYPYSDTVFMMEVDASWYQLTFIGEPGSPTQYVAARAFVGEREESEEESEDTEIDGGDR